MSDEIVDIIDEKGRIIGEASKADLRSSLREKGWFASSNAPNLKRYLDLVAIGTVADLVPLMDENRIFVSYGLKELENTERPGLKALIEIAGLRAKPDADRIAYQIAPRINAAGRVASASTALRLLVTTDAAEAASLANELDRENCARQKMEAETPEEALAMLDGHTDRGIVLFSEKWHSGVIGIVASRLVDRFSKPSVLIALDNGVGKGSARGITAEMFYVTELETFSNQRVAGVAGETGWSNRVTHIFAREGGQWRLIHRHANRLEAQFDPAEKLKGN